MDDNCNGQIDEDCSVPEENVVIGWTQPLRVDENAGGAKPSIFYDPNGDMRIFYNVQGALSKMMSRKRLVGNTDFGSESFVYNNGHQIDLNYAGNGVIDAAISLGNVMIFQSTNNGATWNHIRTFSGGNNVGFYPNYNPLSLYEDAGELRLAYTYEEDTFLFGSFPQVYSAVRTGNTWGVASKIEGGMARVVKEAGDKIGIVSSTGVFLSSDNGLTYNLQSGGAAVATQLKASDSVNGTDGRLYMLRSYYTSVSSRHLSFTYSSDTGNTWANQVIVAESDKYYIEPKLLVEDNIFVAIWQDYILPNKKQALKMSHSTNGGASWSLPEVILTLTGNDEMENYQSFDAASDGNKISVLYSVMNSGRQGVFLIERSISDL